MISDGNALMLSLLGDVLHNRKPRKLSSEQWHGILKELRAQAVDSLPAEFIDELGLSEEDQMQYLQIIAKNCQFFHTLMIEQEKVFSVLESENIRAVAVKGAAAAVYYDRPENRAMGDIDILVLPQDFEKAYNALLGAGYKTDEALEDLRRHIGFSAESGVKIELHYYFSSVRDEEQKRALDDALFRAIPFREKIELCGYGVYMLPPLENGLVLLQHINQHMSAGLGLRQIIDWMYYVERVLDDDLWENGFSQKAEEIGLKRLAMLVTAMCRKYLGLEKNITWCPYEPVCDELMEYILNRGNFGRKIKQSKSKTVIILKLLKNPAYAFSTAQSCGLYNWKATKKYKILRPFAWIYQLGRWANHGIKYGVTPKIMNDAASSAKEETEFMKKIGVTRI